MQSNKFLVLMVVGLLFGFMVESTGLSGLKQLSENKNARVVDFYCRNYQHATSEENERVGQLFDLISMNNSNSLEASYQLVDCLEGIETRVTRLRFMGLIPQDRMILHSIPEKSLKSNRVKTTKASNKNSLNKRK